MSSMFASERLQYRAYEPTTDLDTLHIIRADADAFRLAFWDTPVPQSVEDTKAFATRTQSKYILWVIIYLKPSDKGVQEHHIPVGCIGLTKPEEGEMIHRNTRISLSIVPEHQGRAYGTEAIQWSLRWAFRVYGFHRVMIRVHGYNERALNLYRRLGFQQEGVWREHLWYDGTFWDFIPLGMLDREWEAMQEKHIVQ